METGSCDQLEVVRPDGARQAYRVFDHVTVHITVAESTAHSLGLRLQLHAKLPRKESQVGNVEDAAKKTESRNGEDALRMRADAEMVEVGVVIDSP